METESIQTYERLERYYWWWVGRRKVISNILQRYFPGKNMQILDWGCGPGGNFPMLQKHGRVLGVDASDEAIHSCQEKGIINVIKAGSLSEFVEREKFDLVTNFDVLEHIPEDEEFLRGLNELLVPNGHVLVTVPAYQFLWSQLDHVLGHVRRYTRAELKQKFEQNGYRVLKVSYFITFLAPALIVYRILQKIFKPVGAGSLAAAAPDLPRVINWLFTKLVFFEAWLLKFINLPFGTSIILLARKA